MRNNVIDAVANGEDLVIGYCLGGVNLFLNTFLILEDLVVKIRRQRCA